MDSPVVAMIISTENNFSLTISVGGVSRINQTFFFLVHSFFFFMDLFRRIQAQNNGSSPVPDLAHCGTGGGARDFTTSSSAAAASAAAATSTIAASTSSSTTTTSASAGPNSVKVDLSLNEIDFECPSHLPLLSSGLAAMRQRGQLADVVLRTEDQAFPVRCRVR